MSSDAKSISAPKWDGKQASAGRYMAQVEATAIYYDFGNAIDSTSVIPMKGKYDLAVGETNTAEKKTRKLFEENRRICAMVVLGQQTDHWLALLMKTKNSDYSHGKAQLFLSQMRTRYTPNDTAAEMELDNALERVGMK